jgi:hypothetical protein
MLKARTVRIINNAGGQISQGWKTRIEVLVAIESRFPQDGSGGWMPKPIKLKTDSETIKLGIANVAEEISSRLGDDVTDDNVKRFCTHCPRCLDEFSFLNR